LTETDDVALVHTVATVYTDGSCIGTTALRPGGWAALILNDGQEHVLTGSHPATTIVLWNSQQSSGPSKQSHPGVA
jgi:hypothetical protein